MGDALWPEVTRALEEKRHELTLSNADVADRLKACGLDVRIFQIKTLNFLEMSNITLEQLPETIGHLENMINLALQRNQLIEIPQSIGNLLNLKFLDISFNKLIGLPDSLGSLKALHTLNLNCNELQCLPNLEGLSSLVILHIDHNKLSALPDGIFGLVHLMEIHASHNQITEISEDLNQIEALKIIDLSNNKIKQLPEQIAYCQKLKELNLKENPLSDNRLRKMTSQCSTKAIMDYVASHSGDQTKGKKGKKKKQGKDLHKENEFGVDTRQIYVTRMSKEEKHVIFKDVMKEIRPYIVCTVIKGLDLSDLQMYKKFINLQVYIMCMIFFYKYHIHFTFYNLFQFQEIKQCWHFPSPSVFVYSSKLYFQLQSKLHDTVCDSRMKATIATHDYKQIFFPLVYDAKHPDDISIIPLGQNSEMSGADYIKKLIAQKEQEDKKKKRQQSSGVYR